MKKLIVILVVIGALGGAGWYGMQELEAFNEHAAGTVETSSRRISADVRDVVEAVVIPFETETRTTSALMAGTSRRVQQGVNGEKLVTYTVTYENGQEKERKVKYEVVTLRPLKDITVRGTNTPR